uniref:Uncharacterized protein n=1 Tax=Coniferiporia sulphurascens TaxID=175648 RepID=A0A5B9R9R4_CONSH|nr:hypothetical protein PSUO_000056 [Coniferiporia sulphurascens]QEG57178.1 hypothetical protein PSUO_000056 [Coniferiporia sulphurascens]
MMSIVTFTIIKGRVSTFYTLSPLFQPPTMPTLHAKLRYTIPPLLRKAKAIKRTGGSAKATLLRNPNPLPLHRAKANKMSGYTTHRTTLLFKGGWCSAVQGRGWRRWGEMVNTTYYVDRG